MRSAVGQAERKLVKAAAYSERLCPVGRYYKHRQKDFLFALKHVSLDDEAEFGDLFDNEVAALTRANARGVPRVINFVEEAYDLRGGRHLVLQ